MAGGDGVTVKASYRAESCQGVQFWVPERFQGLMPVGSGSYGIVCKATDTEDGEEVAIKRIEWTHRNAGGAGYWVKVWHFFKTAVASTRPQVTHFCPGWRGPPFPFYVNTQ